MTNIVWNMTRACVWNCKFCCVNAIKVADFTRINTNRSRTYCFNEELNYNRKIEIISKMKQGDFTLDFSGGDLLIDPLNLEVVLFASKQLGKENVGISVSGAFITDEIVEKLAGKVNDVEMTLDMPPFEFYKMRPVGYHEFTANAVEKLRKSDIKVGIETVITRENMDKNSISKLFDWLVDHNVNEWSLLRFFGSGRGNRYAKIQPTHKEYCEAIRFIKELSAESGMKIHFQYLLPGHDGYTLECRAVKKSIGILPDGIVTACFWGVDENMKADRDEFVLGNLKEQDIYEILLSQKAVKWCNNPEKCRIFDYRELERL